MIITVPESAVKASITTVGNAVAGEMYDVVCEAVLKEGIQSTPFITWLNSDGDRVVNGDDISVGPSTSSSLPLKFSILRASHSGRYTCEVTLYSLALQTPLTVSASITLNVMGKFYNAHFILTITSILLCSSTTADDLSVAIVSTPLGPDINAAESFSLTCQASGGTGLYNYQWLSNCTGNCFLNNINPITQTITRDALRSTDSGIYTCTVTDNAGNNGSDSTQIQVVGEAHVALLTQLLTKLTCKAYHHFKVIADCCA